MLENPLISVVIICYNQEQTIARALDSILTQKTIYSFEIIIGEDASPNDETRAICEQYAIQYPDIIRLLPAAKNKGLLKNYADCLTNCKGKYIATCTGDDWWHNPHKLQLQVSFLEEHSQYGVVHTEANHYDPITEKTHFPKQPRNCPEGDVLSTLFKINFIYAISALFRSELLRYADYEDWINQGFVAEDHAMWLAFAPHTFFHYIPESTITYSSATESASRSVSIDKRIEFIEGICRIQIYFYGVNQPLYPSYRELIMYQKKWLIHEILVKKKYNKLKAFGAPLLIRLAPAIYFFLSRLNYKSKILRTLLLKGKTPIEFM